MNNIINHLTLTILLIFGVSQISNATDFDSNPVAVTVNQFKFYVHDLQEQSLSVPEGFVNEKDIDFTQIYIEVIKSNLLKIIKSPLNLDSYSFTISDDYKKLLNKKKPFSVPVSAEKLSQQLKINEAYKEDFTKLVISSYELQLIERQQHMKLLETVEKSDLTPNEKLERYYAIEDELQTKIKLLQIGFREPIETITLIRAEKTEALHSIKKEKDESTNNHK
ncbi:hypothetical protein RX880_07985 [Pseudomonas syringae pv. actinidiae]|nr:hypothetical protein [Pseudomonas syringae pv. actinidiae]MDU8099206.1 hypothetical protein [Pseudomonas syringae pv. actinidiae]MDU8115730.1 hypothetical protein [Pseudomonas syringae pv. actinidiae]MDU8131826.1 hypothetical protein [Pseudomonas syringae pv. actinidiae]MDU8153144.1 hypothetical protein [Pseudomonas syringae pv. actinidiae]